MLLISCLLGLSQALKSLDVYIYTSERSSKGLSNKGDDVVITKEPTMYHIERDKNMYYIKGASNNYLTLTKDHLHYSIDKSDWILRKNINLSDQTGVNHYQLENNSKCLARYDDLLSAEKCDIMSEKQMFFLVSPSNNVDPADVSNFLSGTIDTKIKPVDKTVVKEADSEEEADMYRFMIKKNTVTQTRTIVVQEVPTYVDAADSGKGGVGAAGQMKVGGKESSAESGLSKSIGFGSFSSGHAGEDPGYDSSGELEARTRYAVSSSRRLVDGKDGYYSSIFIPRRRSESIYSSVHPVRGGNHGTSTVDSSESDIGTDSDDGKEHYRKKRLVPRHESGSSSSDTDDAGAHYRKRRSAPKRRAGHMEDGDARPHYRKRRPAPKRDGYAEGPDSNDYYARPKRHGRKAVQDDSIDIARRDPAGIVSDDGSSSKNRGLIPGLIADMNQTKPEKDEVDRVFKNLKKEADEDKNALEPKVIVTAKTGSIPGDKLRGFRMKGMNNENLQPIVYTTMVPVPRGNGNQASTTMVPVPRGNGNQSTSANSNYPSNPYLPPNGMPPQGYPPYQNGANQNQQGANRPSF